MCVCEAPWFCLFLCVSVFRGVVSGVDRLWERAGMGDLSVLGRDDVVSVEWLF